MGVVGQRHAPAPLPQGKRPSTQFYRRLGGPKGRSGQVRKISPPPGFDSQTFQPVVSRYTNYAIMAPRACLRRVGDVCCYTNFRDYPPFPG